MDGWRLEPCTQEETNDAGDDDDSWKKSMSPPVAPALLRKGHGEPGRGGAENEASRLQLLRVQGSGSLGEKQLGRRGGYCPDLGPHSILQKITSLHGAKSLKNRNAPQHTHTHIHEGGKSQAPCQPAGQLEGQVVPIGLARRAECGEGEPALPALSPGAWKL